MTNAYSFGARFGSLGVTKQTSICIVKEGYMKGDDYEKGGITHAEMAMGWIVIAAIILSCLTMEGCIKRFKSGDTEIDFATGFDVGASANAVDTVDNNRGIKPGTGMEESDNVQNQNGGLRGK
jgi:hypothetical protein